ncbi:DUF2076 domain-containing protein [Occallatibacter riparius]|uniref:DUF2076 domain-containing protein n=1 Tax=Occallatibacter riparius TaxID=1002689 RepID=A0A9J7BPB6_9BACT|nr:DUF2076 domain-containing protein [Occallatibacter riparius]UWZ82766.1 DUF2076 domain-containing protein [Occallatibacter riparius]
MTPQEQQLLMQLTQRINQTPLQEKDPDAQNLLGRELGANSDALYIMAQTVLVQNMALEQLKSQVEQLKQQAQQVQQPAHATSFLGRLFGDKDDAQPAPTQQYQQPQQYQPQQQGWQPVPNYQQAPPPPYAQPQYSQPQYVQPQYAQPQYGAVPGGQPSFLRGAMQTAAGVAAGALVFEGVESLLHPWGHGGGWGYGGGPGFGGGFGGPAFGGGYERPVEETVINNYYDQPGQPGAEHHVSDSGGNLNDQLDRDFGSEHHAHEPAQFADASQNTSQLDQGFDNSLDSDSVINDSSLDNVQIDDSGNSFDSGSFDDSSSFDDGGGFDNSGNDGF